MAIMILLGLPTQLTLHSGSVLLVYFPFSRTTLSTVSSIPANGKPERGSEKLVQELARDPTAHLGDWEENLESLPRLPDQARPSG